MKNEKNYKISKSMKSLNLPKLLKIKTRAVLNPVTGKWHLKARRRDKDPAYKQARFIAHSMMLLDITSFEDWKNYLEVSPQNQRILNYINKGIYL